MGRRRITPPGFHIGTPAASNDTCGGRRTWRTVWQLAVHAVRQVLRVSVHLRGLQVVLLALALCLRQRRIGRVHLLLRTARGCIDILLRELSQDAARRIGCYGRLQVLPVRLVSWRRAGENEVRL